MLYFKPILQVQVKIKFRVLKLCELLDLKRLDPKTLNEIALKFSLLHWKIESNNRD
jgi:hypothetical protein